MEISKKILVVDDTESNIEILLDVLGEEYDVFVALDGETALEIAREDKPDLILLDIMMPVMDGYEVCKRLKSDDETKNIPVIFITAKTDEDAIEKAYDVGGIDYASKPFKIKELLARVKTQLELQKLIKELEVSKEELKLLASTDSMTKLYNRRYFMEVSEHILNLKKRNNTDLAVMMLDIDYFKKINDTYGHQVGDDVIIAFSEILKESTRKSDIICRWGGEEFVILFPETNAEVLIKIAEKIRKIIANKVLKIDNVNDIGITVSIGVSEVDDLSIKDSIIQADKALYEAKQSGRNKVCIYNAH